MGSLMSAVALGPVAITVRGAWQDDNAFQKYNATVGILTGDCRSRCNPWGCQSTPSDSIDHAALLVGYGTTAKGEKYWKIKNSYGTKWGVLGYGLIERGKITESGHGQCGIL